jgi:hypothetical protein
MNARRFFPLIAMLVILLGQQLACKSEDGPTSSDNPTPTPTITLTATITPTATVTPTATFYRTATPYPTVNCPGGAVTVGRSSVLVSNPISADYLSFTRVTFSQSVTLSQMSFNVQALNSPATIQMGIYTESAGAPQNLFGQTAAFGLAGAYNTAPLITPVAICPGNYWIAFCLQTSGGYFGYDNSGGISIVNFSSGFTPGILPTVAPSGSVANAYGYYLIGISCPSALIPCP